MTQSPCPLKISNLTTLLHIHGLKVVQISSIQWASVEMHVNVCAILTLDAPHSKTLIIQVQHQIQAWALHLFPIPCHHAHQTFYCTSDCCTPHCTSCRTRSPINLSWNHLMSRSQSKRARPSMIPILLPVLTRRIKLLERNLRFCCQ